MFFFFNIKLMLYNPLMNASGVHCMTVAEMDELAQSAAGAFVTKTATRDYRAGNPQPRYVDVPLGSINSMGLPNEGLAYYLDYCLARQDQQPLQFLSVVGLSYDEIVENLIFFVKKLHNTPPIFIYKHII